MLSCTLGGYEYPRLKPTGLCDRRGRLTLFVSCAYSWVPVGRLKNENDERISFPMALERISTVDLVPSSGDVGQCLMVIRCPDRLMAGVIKSSKCRCPMFRHVHKFVMSLSSVTRATIVHSISRLVTVLAHENNAFIYDIR
jgi:hypothetical protein